MPKMLARRAGAAIGRVFARVAPQTAERFVLGVARNIGERHNHDVVCEYSDHLLNGVAYPAAADEWLRRMYEDLGWERSAVVDAQLLGILDEINAYTRKLTAVKATRAGDGRP